MGEVFRFDLGQFAGPDLRHARRFVEREISRGAGLPEFFANSFHAMSGVARLNRCVEIDENLARLRAFAGAQYAALLQNINDPGRACVAEAEAALQE